MNDTASGKVFSREAVTLANGNTVPLMPPDEFRQWRKRLGWTQVQAAAKLGVSERAIKHYEGATRPISPSVQKLCRAVARGNKPKDTHEFYDPRDIVATPKAFFDRLDVEFHFDIDVCAVAGNAKCKRYFTPEMNGLAQPWRGLTCFNEPAVLSRSNPRVDQEGV